MKVIIFLLINMKSLCLIQVTYEHISLLKLWAFCLWHVESTVSGLTYPVHYRIPLAYIFRFKIYFSIVTLSCSKQNLPCLKVNLPRFILHSPYSIVNLSCSILHFPYSKPNLPISIHSLIYSILILSCLILHLPYSIVNLLYSIPNSPHSVVKP